MKPEDIKKIDWGEVKGVIIATPFYEVKGYSPYIRSLVYTINALNMFRIPWRYFELSGDSYVDRAKNTLVHHFLLVMDKSISTAWRSLSYIRYIEVALVPIHALSITQNWPFALLLSVLNPHFEVKISSTIQNGESPHESQLYS